MGEPKGSVIVVGAGLAGLAAAHALTADGWDVQVLEARSRCGGRVLTLREGFADGMYAEAGPMGFLDIHERVQQYVNLFQLPFETFKQEQGASVFLLGGKRVLEKPGRPVTGLSGLRGEEQSLGVDGLWEKYIGAPAAALGDPTQAGWQPPAATVQYDEISAADFLRGEGASPGALAILEHGLSGLYGDGLESYSAFTMLLGAALLRNAKTSNSITGGNDNLPKAFAAALGARIRYGTPVVKIAQSAGGVTVTYLQGGQPATAAAGYVVCAIPFPLLRRIEVSPAFSAARREILEKTLNTSVTRVFLQSRTKFWTEGPAQGTAETSLPIMSVFSAYDRPGTPRGILESYMSGDHARSSAALAPGERLEFALGEMKKVFPPIADHFEGGMSVSWDQDEWAKGAYAWNRTGEYLKLFPNLAVPEGRIHFAGDQTSIWVGWMEGAIESGLRAAREIEQSAGVACAAGGAARA